MSKIHILSFQSTEVLSIILRDKIYKANLHLCRERRSYEEDIAQLEGSIPIWGFSSKGDKFLETELRDGVEFFNFKCEMSVDVKDLSELLLLELFVDGNEVFTGISHNAFERAKVFPQIKYEDLVAVYQLQYDRDTEYGWYFPKVKVLFKFKEGALFKEDFDTRTFYKIE